MAFIPPISRREAPVFRDSSHRTTIGSAFVAETDTYARVRPGYPSDVVKLLQGTAPPGLVVDIGAGTGKLTEQLHSWRPGQVVALDVSREMIAELRSRLDVPAWQAAAEETALASDAVAVACCAQTWHWVDVERASAELDRVVKAEGCVLLAWNTIDVTEPWAHRFTRIAHSGDIQRDGFLPDVRDPWKLSDLVRVKWKQSLEARELFDLMATRAYWLRASDATREKMTANLSWFLYEHQGWRPDSEIELPYRSDIFVYRR
ncbi:class I SAM-dependent methyltransferase [Corynebacterium epidermidicanis]|uniref:Methyltransferase family protein n=1 Tax=Corynebacterium epidermidicanis TaxID=1050174 RepID=A0A0G3GW18_9CORY|nr:class I SAM-dependent methyltransferase [Corynebacterium epidermidicanis]AKK03067.1 methyltransferase family protein [Corynebacterium epidermidicanis]